MQNITANIRLLDFFKKLDENNIEYLAQISHVQNYLKGYVFYYEEESQNKLYFLIDGLLKLYKVSKTDNEIYMNHVCKNSLISEISSLDEEELHTTTNAIFVENSKVLEIDYKPFKKHFLDNDILTKELLCEFIKRNKQLNSIIDREVVFDATAKVAYSIYDDLSMCNTLKRQDMASFLHIQPETLSRILKKLVRQDIIGIEMSDIVIKDKKRLKKIYSGTNYEN